VDDNATNRIILRKYLLAFKADVQIFHTPQGFLKDFLKKYENGQAYDLCLIDYNMPHIDGVELARQMRKEAPGHSSGIVLLSSITDMVKKVKLKAYGITAQLNKPLKVSQLFNTIHYIMWPEARKEDKQKEEITTPQRDYRILMAEDNRINQQVAQSLLAKLGQKADLAPDGTEAVELYRKNTYHIVFMDVAMPKMDGIEATKAIREHEAANGLKPAHIVALTAGVTKEEKERCLRAGMDEFIPKPFSLNDITGVFQKLCENS
jgi:CheY-like chemotaxis protein